MRGYLATLTSRSPARALVCALVPDPARHFRVTLVSLSRHSHALLTELARPVRHPKSRRAGQAALALLAALSDSGQFGA
jgi:hypothetical protein